MDEQKSYAECLNMGRAVYCMQCVRMNKEYKDMFRSSTPLSVPYPYSDKKTETPQPEKRGCEETMKRSSILHSP